MTSYLSDPMVAIVIGLCCGFILSGLYRLVTKLLQKQLAESPMSGNAAKPTYYITGDKHRDFKNLIRFCKKNKTSVHDVMIVLGDAGFNYFGDKRDEQLKKKLSKVKITLFCIHGNKENRPQNIDTYVHKEFCGGEVFYEEAFPNILFSKDCEVYQFGAKSAIVLGGSHSVDKFYRIEHDYPWWSDEQPDDKTKRLFEAVLRARNNTIDYIFTHTVPFKYEPTEMFISNKENNNKNNKKRKKRKKASVRKYEPDIDKTTERWLDFIEETVSYKKWFCGHYHTDKTVDRVEIMFKKIKKLFVGEEQK